MMTMETELKISEEPLPELDEARLLPSAEKRARDVGKKLDRLAARQGARGPPGRVAGRAGPPGRSGAACWCPAPPAPHTTPRH